MNPLNVLFRCLIKNKLAPNIGLYNIASKRGKFRILNYNLRHSVLYSPYPITAKIEINSDCNLNCVMCLRNKMKRPLKRMSLDEFKTVLDNLPSIVEWSPHGYNEPLLHPQFFDFVKEAKDRGIFLTLVTNGTLLSPENIKKLLSLNPRQIVVSIHAVGKRYEEIRKGAVWKDVLNNITNLTICAKTLKTQVSFYTTVWQDNVDQIDPLVNLAGSLGVPISFCDITWMYETGESQKAKSIRENRSHEEIKSIIGKYVDNKNVSIHLEKLKKRSCYLPWFSIYVDVNGDVYPCTDNLESCMGNVFRESAKEIFNKKIYRQFRFNSYYGLSSVNCRDCQGWVEPEFNKKTIKKLQRKI